MIVSHARTLQYDLHRSSLVPRALEATPRACASSTSSRCGARSLIACSEALERALEEVEMQESHVLTPFRRRQLLKRTSGGALCTGADGPRAGAGRSAAWCEARWCFLRKGGLSAAWGRTVRPIADGAWISLPGGTPSGSRDPRWCLGSGRPT
jgi:hypothetical protein